MPDHNAEFLADLVQASTLRARASSQSISVTLNCSR
jgi:hypothetical protein